MMGFIFLGYKVKVKAVEMVGHIISGRNPATKPTTQTIVMQNVVFVATGAWSYRSGLLSK